MADTKDVYLSVTEEEMVASLQEIYNVTEAQAVQSVISNKKQNAWMYQQRGNLQLAETLKQNR